MIRVTEDNLGLYLFAKFAEMHSLYRAAGADRHKDWSLNLAVVGRN